MSTYVYDIVGSEALDSFLAQRTELVLIDFWAERCGPCRMVGPVLEHLAEQYAGKIVIAKIDVDTESNQELAQKYAVTSIPQVTLVQSGNVVDQFV